MLTVNDNSSTSQSPDYDKDDNDTKKNDENDCKDVHDTDYKAEVLDWLFIKVQKKQELLFLILILMVCTLVNRTLCCRATHRVALSIRSA